MRRALLALVVAILAPMPSLARLRAHYDTATVVDRSDLIVVGRIRRGSIEYVPTRPVRPSSWDYRCVLVVESVIKGTWRERELPVTIHYGLTPVVGGYEKRLNHMINLRGNRKDYPENIIEIIDTGSSARGGGPLVRDAAENNLWFLRKFDKGRGLPPYGIRDPQDLNRLAILAAVEAYLEGDGQTLCRELLSREKTGAACAAELLGSMRYEPAAPILREIATSTPKEGFPDIRVPAIKALKNFQGEEAKRTLITIINSPSGRDTLYPALHGLSDYVEPDAIAAVASLLGRLDNDRDRYVCSRDYASGVLRAMQDKARKKERARALAERVAAEGIDAVYKALTKDDVDALTYAGEAALAEAALKYCFHRFGADLARYKDDLETFWAVMTYLETVKYRAAAVPLAKALLSMKWNPDYQAIRPIVKVLKATCETDDPAVLPILLKGYERNVGYLGGPAKALEAVGGESAAAALVGIMLRTANRGLGHRKSDVATVINNIIKSEHSAALDELKGVIDSGSGQNRSYAMSIASRLPDESLNALFLRVAGDERARVWVRGDAIRIIGSRKMGDARARIEASGKENPSLHQAVAHALKHIGTEDSLPLLASFLDEPEYVRIYAAEAIGAITGSGFKRNEDGVKAAKQWWNEHKADYGQ